MNSFKQTTLIFQEKPEIKPKLPTTDEKVKGLRDQVHNAVSQMEESLSQDIATAETSETPKAPEAPTETPETRPAETEEKSFGDLRNLKEVDMDKETAESAEKAYYSLKVLEPVLKTLEVDVFTSGKIKAMAKEVEDAVTNISEAEGDRIVIIENLLVIFKSIREMEALLEKKLTENPEDKKKSKGLPMKPPVEPT